MSNQVTNTLAKLTVKDLYPLALAEGEGMGTAYEYYVKRMALSRMLSGMARPQSILIAGLPQKYGASLDFVLLASELGAELTVVDDRQQAVDRLRDGMRALSRMDGAPSLNLPTVTLLTDLDSLATLQGSFDLALSSEVLQRLTPAGRAAYVARLRELSAALGLFCPNADNEAHNSISGLAGLRLEEMTELLGAGNEQSGGTITGFIDMPPFPPGITRSAEQREDATSGRFEAIVMWGLRRYAHVERFIPTAIRRRQAHIVYALRGG